METPDHRAEAEAAELTAAARRRNAELEAERERLGRKWRVVRGNEPHALDPRTLAELEDKLEAFRLRRLRREPERTVAPATFAELHAEVEKGRADLAKHAGRPTPPPLDAEELDRLRWLHDAMRDARTRPDDSVPGGRRIPDELVVDVLDPLERAITLLAAMPEAREALEHVAAAVHRLVGHSTLRGHEELSTARSKAELALIVGRGLMGLGVGTGAAVRIVERDLGVNSRTAYKALAD